jgi:hypothetical protein
MTVFADRAGGHPGQPAAVLVVAAAPSRVSSAGLVVDHRAVGPGEGARAAGLGLVGPRGLNEAEVTARKSPLVPRTSRCAAPSRAGPACFGPRYRDRARGCGHPSAHRSVDHVPRACHAMPTRATGAHPFPGSGPEHATCDRSIL